jgi:hypothetical protein
MTILDSRKFLFISFEQAGRGHRMARVLCALPEVYWYSHPANGKQPWNVYNPETNIQQRKISKFHYNRYLPDGTKLPPPYDYVQPYLPDAQRYYQDMFVPQFKQAGGEPLLDQYILPYCTHGLPADVYDNFPNAKIINIVHDPVECTNRYMKVGLNFPGFVKHTGTIEPENARVQYLQALADKKPDLRVKDVWAQDTHGTFWKEEYSAEFRKKKQAFFDERRQIRESTTHSNVLNIYNVRDYAKMKEFIRG